MNKLKVVLFDENGVPRAYSGWEEDSAPVALSGFLIPLIALLKKSDLIRNFKGGEYFVVDLNKEDIDNNLRIIRDTLENFSKENIPHYLYVVGNFGFSYNIKLKYRNMHLIIIDRGDLPKKEYYFLILSDNLLNLGEDSFDDIKKLYEVLPSAEIPVLEENKYEEIQKKIQELINKIEGMQES